MSSPTACASFSMAPTSECPPALPGFEHIHRYWDKTRGKYAAKIHPGELYVTHASELISTVLGSCIAVCIRDPAKGIGGMNHFMLPATNNKKLSIGADLSAAARYGNFAMEHLINSILRFGGSKTRFEIKVFGGGKVLAQMTNIGLQNIKFVRDYISIEGLKIVAEDTGGIHPRKVVYDPVSGKVAMKKLKAIHNNTIEARETRYRDGLSSSKVEGEVDLF